jgi:hypothetical protein
MATTHRTASGKSIDMAALVSKNEKVRAISNVPMNARGDIIDSNDEVVSPVSQRVARTYNKTTMNPTAQPNKTSPTASPALANQATNKEEPPVVFLEDMSEDEIEYFDEFDADVPPKTDTESEKK